MSILNELFHFERPATLGERIHLRFFEVFVCTWAIVFAWEWASYIPRLGDVILPLGLAQWIDVRFMFDELAARLNAALLTACCVTGFLGRFRPAYALALLAFHLQYVARYSQGEISHGSNVIGTAIAGLAIGTLVERTSIQARRFAFGFDVLFTAIAYASAALCKLVATGPTWVSGSHLALWIHERSVDGFGYHGEIVLNGVQQLLLDYPWLATTALTFGLLAEAGALLGIRRSLRPVAFSMVIAMHVGIWFSMDLLFPLNVSMLAVLAFPWDRWLQSAYMRLRPASITEAPPVQS